MKTLIIPDVHNRIGIVDKILKTQEYNRVVYLGDFFDDFGDSPEIAEAVATWLVNRMDTSPTDIFLMGNHDYSYHPRVRRNVCAGYTPEKKIAINRVMTYDHWARFRFTTMVGKYLLSHGGLHPSFIKPGFSVDKLEETLQREFDTNPDRSPWFQAGYCRMGPQEFGGITWLDWDYEFQPIANVSQIVGHTQGFGYRSLGDNHCFDDMSKYFGIVTDGNLRVRKVS